MENININIISLDDMKLYVDSNDTLFSDILITEDMVSLSSIRNIPIRIDAFVIAIVTKGVIKATINMKDYLFKEGMLAILLPEHIIQLTQGNEMHVKAIVLSNSFLNDLRIDIHTMVPMYSHIINHPQTTLSQEDSTSLCKYFDLIKDTIHFENNRRKKEISQNLISAMMHKLSIVYRTNVSDDAQPKKDRKEMFYDKFMALLTQHHKTERKVEFYADKLCLTPKYLSSVLKSVSGKSASEWIDHYTILEAKSMLKFTQMTIKEIAFQLSFPNQSFFSKYFRKHTGMSPKAYKEM